ncbi:MAG: HAD-IC family P-type ATPase [Thermodesulfobacteriota bacterium]|nr:HAD-IC family P-type ATPase [Thermodesulfobacteriota bacterium]
MIRTVHNSVKGRVRLQVDGLYRSSQLKHYLEPVLAQKEGILAARANIITGRILVHYSLDKTLTDVKALLQQILDGYKKDPFSRAAGGVRRISLPRQRSKERKKSLPSPTFPAVLQADSEEDWHATEAVDVLKSFSSVSTGLTEEEAARRLEKYGRNALPDPAPRSGLAMFIEQFQTIPVALLSAAAGISVLTGGVVDAAAIMGVVCVNSVIGYLTESRSERTIESLKRLVTPRALVVREGKARDIEASGLVPGDILALRPGRYVGADARIVDAARLSIDESALTGESMPVIKSTRNIPNLDLAISDRRNMCYMGTLVTGGQGKAVVVRTGRVTEMGKIQGLVGEAKPPETPMSLQLDEMGTQMVIVSSTLCGVVFLLGIFRGFGMLEMLKTSISLAVAAVPEGLPIVATTTLALGIQKMRRQGILIRHLGAIEALGSSQVICLDKTGTLTFNRMSIVRIQAGKKQLVCDQESRLPSGETIDTAFREELSCLVMTTILCNESEINKNSSTMHFNGSPTENAFLQLAVRNGLDVLEARRIYPLQKTFHRSESRNFMTTVHATPEQCCQVTVKGSPAEVLAMCARQMLGGRLVDLTEEDRMAILLENDKMAASALRVLGGAYCRLDGDVIQDEIQEVETLLEGKLIWLGLVGMADPIRKGVKELIARFHHAGIKTVMITGDQSPTAYTVGKELQLNGESGIKILDSTSLSSMKPEKMIALSQQTNIFARVSPSNKLQIVQAFQDDGKVVVMTGDGINDGPALKKADIGVAMGRTGTDVAREISDVVLEDDRLETMIIAVQEGRTIYINVRKALRFLLSTNLSEIVVTFTANLAGMGQPLTQMQLLWINLITDIFPGLALSLELPEQDVMAQDPRDPREPIIRRRDLRKIFQEAGVISAGAMASYGYGIIRYGVGPQAGSIAFLTLTIGQLLHALNCRSDHHGLFEDNGLPPNKHLNLALGGSFALQLLAMLIPGLRSILGIGRLGLTDLTVISGGAALPLLLNNAMKTTNRTRSVKRKEAKLFGTTSEEKQS